MERTARMNLLSFEFLLAFSLLLCLYWLPALDRPMQNALLLLASFGLLALFNPGFVALLVGYALCIHLLSRPAASARGRQLRYTLLVLLILTLFILFKYAPALHEPLAHALARLDLPALPAVELLLPLGLSYYSFHSVSYVLAVQRREIAPAPFADLLLYLGFFPCLIAGPINRAQHFMPQIQADRRQLLEPRRALLLMALAISKLFFCSAWLSQHWVDPVFADPAAHSAGQIALAIHAYAWVIYCNFSGYTELVTGLALLLGFQLPANFNAPYLARNPKDFWARWHISLSGFIRDYIYIPLGGSRHGRLRTALHVLVAMLLSGLWHGAALTYLAWAALHAFGVIIASEWPRRPTLWPPLQVLEQQLARLLCFHFVCLAWVFFRSDSLDHALLMLQRLANPALWSPADGALHGLLGMALVYLIYPQLVRLRQALERHCEHTSWSLYPLALTLWLSLMFSLAPAGVPNVIYAAF